MRRKVCRFCADRDSVIDYKDTRALSSFVTERGKLVPSRITGNCAKHQRELTTAIKRARAVALLPFSTVTCVMQPVALRLGTGVAISTALYGLACAFPLAAAPVALLVPLPGLVVATRAPSSECSLWFFLTAIAVGVIFGPDAMPGFIMPFGLPTLAVGGGHPPLLVLRTHRACRCRCVGSWHRMPAAPRLR